MNRFMSDRLALLGGVRQFLDRRWSAAFSQFSEQCLPLDFHNRVSNDVELSNSSGANGELEKSDYNASPRNGLQIRCQFNSCKFKILFVILNYPIISLSDHSDLWSANNFGKEVWQLA